MLCSGITEVISEPLDFTDETIPSEESCSKALVKLSISTMECNIERAREPRR